MSMVIMTTMLYMMSCFLLRVQPPLEPHSKMLTFFNGPVQSGGWVGPPAGLVIPTARARMRVEPRSCHLLVASS